MFMRTGIRHVLSHRIPSNPRKLPVSSSRLLDSFLIQDHSHSCLPKPLNFDRCAFATLSEPAKLDNDSTIKIKPTPQPVVPIPNKTNKKARKRSSKGDKNIPPIQLLQLRKIHPEDTVKQHFELIAHRTELAKLKWIQTLRRKLEKVTPGRNKASRDLWKLTQEFMERKSIPVHCKNSFWNLLIAPMPKKVKKKLPSTTVSAEDLAALESFRQKVVEKPIFWNHSQKHALSKTLEKEGKETLESYQAARGKYLQTLHSEKSEEDKNLETKFIADTLRMKLPPTYYRRLVKHLNTLVTGKHGTKEEGEESSGFKANMQLFSHLRECTQGHVHLVALDLARYCYLDIATDINAIRNEDGSEAPERFDITANDERLQASKDDWEAASEEFVSAFTAIQTMLVNEHDQVVQEQAKKNNDDLLADELSKSNSTDSDTDDDDDDDDELAYDGSEESVLATFEGAASSEETAAEAIRNNQLRQRRYIVYEAIAVGRWANGESSEEAATPENQVITEPAPSLVAPTDRLVFVDNLPIDMTETRLLEAYARCGPIDNIQIFQQRPDLDPGRKLEDSKRKIKKPSAASRRRWERPRTALYAMIEYRDAQGAAKATVDPLRIFGMVLDMHQLRSYRASDMTKLYIEDIASTHDVTSIEYALSQVLHPDLYVCLDVGRRQRKSTGTANCEIKFPNFEMAYWAHTKLASELDMLKHEDGCAIHWMKTPADAMLYWTRQLNF